MTYYCPPPPVEIVEHVYQRHLGRPADPVGIAYWSTIDLETMVVHVALSAEAEVAATGARVDETLDAFRCGWVDLGNGVYGPAELLPIGDCESDDDYYAANPRSSARGRWQFVTRTWRWVTTWLGGDWPAQADQASPADQDRVAVALAVDIPGGGLGHWACHR